MRGRGGVITTTTLTASTFPKLTILSGTPLFSTNLFWLAFLVGLNLSFLTGVLAWFIKITKVVPFKSFEVFRKDLFLALHCSCFFIDDLSSSLPSFVSCSLYADNSAICSSASPVCAAVEAKQGALIQLERWSEYWCFPLNPSICKASFSSVDSHRSNLQPHYFLFHIRIRFNPTPTFLGVTFVRTLSFSKHASSLKSESSSSQGLTRYLCFLMGPL